MNRSELLDELKKAMAGEPTILKEAEPDAVVAEIHHDFNQSSRMVRLDFRLQAAEGVTIENFSASLSYFINGQEGQVTALRGARSWGIAEGPVIQSGMDTIVADRGNHSAKWMVGTFIKTAGGYKMWTTKGEFPLKA